MEGNYLSAEETLSFLLAGKKAFQILCLDHPEIVRFAAKHGWPLPIGFGEEGSLSFTKEGVEFLSEVLEIFPEKVEEYLRLCLFFIKTGNA